MLFRSNSLSGQFIRFLLANPLAALLNILSRLGGSLVLIDARKPGEFKNDHIPGALPFSTYELLAQDSSLDGMKAFGEMVMNRFMIAGVTLDRPVVVYDDGAGSRAARELWMLEYLGHRNARMLHGGFAYWQRVGGPVETDDEVSTVCPTALRPTQHPE